MRQTKGFAALAGHLIGAFFGSYQVHLMAATASNSGWPLIINWRPKKLRLWTGLCARQWSAREGAAWLLDSVLINGLTCTCIPAAAGVQGLLNDHATLFVLQTSAALVPLVSVIEIISIAFNT